MKNNDYWKKRFEILEEAQMAKGEEYYKELDKQYRKAMNDIESQLTRWYGRIAENNEINMSQARKWLKGKELDEFKWTVEEYIQYGKKNAINPIWLKELENASARAHINRLEALKIQLQQTVESLYQGQNIGMTDALRRIYEDGYYHSAFEIQRGLNVGWSIPALDSARVTQMLSKPWTADGSNFSDRIWKAKGDLVNTLHTELTQSIIMGRAPDKAIKRIADKFNTSRSRAGRLVMTESAFFASASQRDCFNDFGVEKYEICATLDNRTSEICQELDGKVFMMSEYEPGLTAPPFHCWCRTTTIPSFDDNFGERIARDESGRQYYVSDDMKYNDWKKEYVQNSVSETQNLEYMSNSFRPLFGDNKTMQLGQSNIELVRVTNSEFNMWAEVGTTRRSKSVRLYEKQLHSIRAQLPSDFNIPQIAIIDFNKYGINSNAIAGYTRQLDTVFINSKYDTSEKIIKYLTKNEGFFASTAISSPIMHELGHKYHYDLVDLIANKRGLSYNEAKRIFDKPILEYMDKMGSYGIKSQISGYAYDGYSKGEINETMAEFFALESKDTELAKFIDKQIKGGLK